MPECLENIQLIVLTRDGLVPKSHSGNRFYEGHRDIAENASQHFKKESIPIKMYFKSLVK
jgi:hypothetical protein